MKKKLIFLLFAATFWSQAAISQSVQPYAYYYDSNGNEQESRAITDEQAKVPMEVTFRSNPSDMEGYSPAYEWHFNKMEQNGDLKELFVRYEEDTHYTFSESGTFHIIQTTHITKDGEEVDSTSTTITITIANSFLDFPNAFSPNDDGYNDTFKAKKGVKNIVSFRGIIITRWGQKIFEWNDPEGEWDGKHNGTDVREGVYFLIVTAKGSDGKEYNIRKDVNLLRGKLEGGETSGK